MNEGPEAAVSIPAGERRRLENRRPMLKELLLGDGPRFDLPVPPRGSAGRRKPPGF